MSSRLGVSVRKTKSRSRRAGLLFPVGRIHRLCRKGPWVGSRIGAGAPVYLAAVMEYLAAELLEQAGLASRFGRNEGRITPRHLKMAVKRDQELNILCDGVTMVGECEVVEKDWLKLGKADMAGDLRAPTSQSMGRKEERRLKKKQKKEDKSRSVDKRRGQYLADLGAKDKRPIVDLTDPSHEPIIDLTEDSNTNSRAPNGPSGSNITGKASNSKRMDSFENDIFRSDHMSEEKHKKAREDASKKQKPSLAASVGKPGSEPRKVHSFEEEMFRVERRYELLKKGREDKGKQQRSGTGLGRSLVEQRTAGKTGKDLKMDESRRVHSFREEMIRIDQSRFKLKKGGEGRSRQYSGGQEEKVEEFEDDQRLDGFRGEIKMTNNKFIKKAKDSSKQHGHELSRDVIEFVKLLDGVREGGKRSHGV